MQFKKLTVDLVLAVAVVFIALIAGNTMAAGPAGKKDAGATPVFDGGKSTWHGFTRYDFIMNDKTLAITPFKAPRGEGDGINAPPAGMHRCIIVVPKTFALGHPWSWRGCYWNYAPQTEIALLNKGFCVAYISAMAQA